MSAYINKIVGLSVIATLVGCTAMTSYSDILYEAESVYKSDGINRDEAVLLAQEYMIKNNFDQKHSIYNIGPIGQLKEADQWLIIFLPGVDRGINPRRQFEYVPPKNVVVDKVTGHAEIALEQYYF